jgi:hypothetical protein
MAKTFSSADDDFYDEQELITSTTGQNLAKYGVNQDWYQTEVLTRKVVYVTARAVCKNPKTCTTAARKARDEAREDYQKILGQLVELLKALPTVTHTDLDDMKIAYDKGGGGRPGPVPFDSPDVTEDVSTIRYLKFTFRAKGSESRGKPLYVHGTELVGGFFAEQPEHVSQIKQSWFTTKSTLVIEFDEADRGKIFYYCVRWESRSGQKGPWSKIMSVMIP